MQLPSEVDGSLHIRRALAISPLSRHTIDLVLHHGRIECVCSPGAVPRGADLPEADALGYYLLPTPTVLVPHSMPETLAGFGRYLVPDACRPPSGDWLPMAYPANLAGDLTTALPEALWERGMPLIGVSSATLAAATVGATLEHAAERCAESGAGLVAWIDAGMESQLATPLARAAAQYGCRTLLAPATAEGVAICARLAREHVGPGTFVAAPIHTLLGSGSTEAWREVGAGRVLTLSADSELSADVGPHALSLLHQRGVVEGLVTLETFSDLLGFGIARLARLGDMPLTAGCSADLMIFDPEEERSVELGDATSVRTRGVALLSLLHGEPLETASGRPMRGEPQPVVGS